MSNGKFVAYYRVSTAKQGQSGLGLEAQQKMVTDYLNGGRWTLLNSYTEVESGKKADRPELQAAIRECRKHGATLVIAKLDRLARNVAFIANLMEGGVDFVVCDMPAANRFTVHVMAAAAEHEREQISKRTKDALAAAKARGVRLGGRRTDDQYRTASTVLRRGADEFADNVKPIIREIQDSGVTSYDAIAKCLNARGIATRRGGIWHASTVRNIVLRSVRS